MTEFEDRAGNSWAVDITCADIARVDDNLDVNLATPQQPMGNPVLGRLIDDSLFAMRVLYVVILPEIEEQGMDEKEWLDCMGPQAMSRGKDALLEAYINFFRESGREDAEKMARKMQEVRHEVERRQSERAAEMTVEDVLGPPEGENEESETEKPEQKTSANAEHGSSSGNTQESSE